MKHKLVAWLVCLTLILSFLPDQARAEGEDGDWQLVGQTGGTTKALLAEGTTLYVGSGLHVLIVDVSTPGQLRVIGTSPLLPDFVEGIASDGAGKLFVSCGLGGLVALDVKNPAKPSQIGVLDTRGYTESVTLYGKYALVADGPQGLQIVDVSDPAKMKTVSEAYPLAYAYDVAIADKTAYLAGGGSGVFTVDLSDPLHPKEAGLTPLDGFTYDLELLDGKLYAACAWGGVTALTLDDTLAPKRVANAQTSGWAMALTAFGKDLLVLDGADGAMIYSAASTALVRLSSYTLGGFALAGAVSGTTAFVLDREKGLLMLDLSKKSDPTLVGRWMPLLEGRRLTLQDGVCYVAGGASGLKVFDLSDASNPAETFWYDCGSSGYVFKTLLHDEKAYVAVNNSTGPFMIFDASDPLHPAVMGYLRWGLDVPVAPDRSLTLGTDGFVYAAAEHHDYSIDVRNPQSPEVASSVESNGTGNADCSGDLLVTFGGQGIRMIDVSDPANLKLVSTLPLSETSGEAIRFINPETIIAAAYSGVWIVDVSDPANPKKISEIKNLGSVMDIFIDGATAYLSTLGNGIQVVALSDLTKPKLEETIMTPGLAYDCSVEGNLLIVADSYAGICVYQRGQALAESAGDEGSALFKLTFTQNLEVFEIREPGQSASPKETYDVVVTSAADAGPGSLREAILALKSGTTITFDPAIFPIDQPKMIRLDSALPAIGENYTTLDASNAGVILDGSNLTTGRGIYIKGSHCAVMGLQIYNFPEMGIEVEADYARIGGSREIGTGPVGQGNVISGNGMHGVFVSGFPGWHCAVSGNLIGTDVTGTKAVPNFFGVFVGADSYETVIGGTKPGEGNVISGNANINCDSFGQYTRIVGNLIGVDITGTKAVNTDTSGSVKFECGATGIIVGGTTPAERNIISGAQMGVIFSDGDSHSCSVIGNYIGTDITGTKAIPNHEGVLIWTSGNHRVGGTRAGEANLISGNQNGVQLNGYGVSDNIVIGNVIGYDANGEPLPNETGVSINMGQKHAIIGGYTQAESNRIYGGSISMRISDHGIQACCITGNFIDNPKGLAIYFENGANQNFVQGNTIAKSSGNSLRVDYGEGNMLRANLLAGNKPQDVILLHEGGNRALAAPSVTSATPDEFSGKTVPFGRVETYLFDAGEIRPLGFTDADANGAFTCAYPDLVGGKRFILLVTDAFGNTSSFSTVFALPVN